MSPNGERHVAVDPAAQMPALEERIYELIQNQRHTLDPSAKSMTLDPELVALARQRSSDMAAHGGFSDGSGDPHISATRLMAEDAKFQGLLGENVAAQHYSKAIGVDVESFAQRFVATWIGSASHKENLSFADYDRTGVGAAINGDTVFVTQLFASDLPDDPKHKAAGPAQIESYPSARAARSSASTPSASLRGSQGTSP